VVWSALLVACGASEGAGGAGVESVGPPSSEPAIAVPSAAAPAASDTSGSEEHAVSAPAAEPADGTPAEGAPCSAPAGISASPRTFQQAVALMNALPKPTTLPCFLESLARPLEVYLTSSELSLQPADGADRPRTFIVLGDLVLSVVTNPKFISRLELGYRTAPGRSVKGEVAFPLTRGVTPGDITERIRVGSVSICGGCHGAETRPNDPFFPDGAFESAIAVPLSPYEVELQSLRALAASCDREHDPERCAQLSALFDHGEVRRSTLWDGG
jgi:hypothetical protein